MSDLDAPTADSKVEGEGATPEPESKDEALGEGGVKALKAERERAVTAERELAELRAERQKVEDAKLPELERLRKDAEDARKAASESGARLSRLEAIAEHSVPKAYQHLVFGTDAESYAASAKGIAELAAAAEGKASKPDPVNDSGERNKTSSGGSIAAGREAFAAKNK